MVINLSDGRSQGCIRVPWDELAGQSWQLIDSLTGDVYGRDGNEMRDPGLYVDLEGGKFHFLKLLR